MDTTLQAMTSGAITPTTAIAWFLIAALFGGLGGIIGANWLGGKYLGKELVIMMGMPAGIVAAAPGILIGLLLLKMM
ncbi:MAG: hypothetical protein KGS72_01235 [Cyanobacteria bacterium REEB67]|nr:hypothetical protein [Cyanobacteria bacterium REEB67]